MAPSTLSFFRTQVMDDLISAVRTDESKEDWLGRVALAAGDPEARVELEWKFGSPLPVLVPAADADASNAILLHQYLGSLTPQQASDRRLWTHLSLVDFRSYTDQRWSLEGLDDKGKWRGRVGQRWMQRTESRVSLARNAISRLWWAAALTHDPGLSHRRSAQTGDQYAYTRLLLAKQDLFVGIVERELGIRSELLFAWLDNLAAIDDVRLESYARELAKELTLVGGYKEPSLLSVEQLGRMVTQAATRVTRILESTKPKPNNAASQKVAAAG